MHEHRERQGPHAAQARGPSGPLTKGDIPSNITGPVRDLPNFLEELIPPQSSSEWPLRVKVKASTLERLVDVLLHRLQCVSVTFSDDNGKMPLRDGKHRDLKANHWLSREKRREQCWHEKSGGTEGTRKFEEPHTRREH